MNEVSELSEFKNRGNTKDLPSDSSEKEDGKATNKCNGSKNKFIITNNYFNNSVGTPISTRNSGKGKPIQKEEKMENPPQEYIDESKILEQIMESIGKIKDKKHRWGK